MLLAPFVGAVAYCKRKKGDILEISQNKVKDPRYFGKAFAKYLEENHKKREAGMIQLSRKEEYLNCDKEVKYKSVMNKLMICMTNDFVFPSVVKSYTKEIYSAQNVINNQLYVDIRAAYAKNKMVLANGTRVDRWVDAEETMAIYDKCDLGMSASAGRRMSVGKNCTFRRLYAPEILIGQYPDNIKDNKSKYLQELLYKGSEFRDIIRDITTVNEEIANSQGEICKTILTKHDLIVLEKMIVKGDVRTEKSLRLCDGVVVYGNIFAEKDIHIGKDVIVLGNVFTQGSIYVENGAILGYPGRIISVIARDNITFENDIVVYGYVSCEKKGKIIEKNIEKERFEFKLLDTQEYITSLILDDITQYNALEQQGYRKEEFLKNVEIKVKAKKVPRSMFFACESLESVSFSPSIEIIEDYAFADCVSLKELVDFSDSSIKKIGISSFENCKSLENIKFSIALESISAAAFCGCENIKNISFSSNDKLKVIGEHCFRGCKNLETIELPDSIEKIGSSAFLECEALRPVIIPVSCEHQPGIEELRKNSNIKIIVRNAEEQHMS